MKAMEKVAEVPLPFSGISDSVTERGDYNRRLSGWLSDCHGVWYNVSLIVPSVLFVVYLSLQAKKSFTKLSRGRSYIMIAYYGLLWLVSVLNIAWCSLQTWECTSGKEFSWNLLSLFTASGMLFLEISLMAFLLQGNYTSGLDALTRTFVVSGIIVGADILLKAIYVFAFEIPLFIDSEETTQRVKWGLWVVHKLLLTAVYGVILCMYNSKWREKLPARPAFYNYIIAMFSLNVAALFACGLMGNDVGFGFWLYNLTTICYHDFYLPLLYVTFLADFFQEEDMRLENAYYSEMKDAGFFDADWD
ncbi:protein CANDIDATE G-PROTEIN COUPLED RECEPTOR 2-like [Telopea speciosissima]|uniref:protein CANDIDATE G-PROTEIN COUPLED RECEPTOR 2-like n=1 Tax=Telopea speciosissima TaxID=54955 RepID=UPI001CC7952B|nr:protein CANDIDATE G-PROTEIN COUPLED RECEPTOR 2-like [Telopea speciosissima]